MKNYPILLVLLCVGISAKSQLDRKPRLSPLSTITEIKPGSVLKSNHNNNTINLLQRPPKAGSVPNRGAIFQIPTSKIRLNQIDGMPVLLPSLEGLAQMPVAQPLEGFRSEMPIKDLSSQYR